MRPAIPARTKLQISLRYLATGDSFSSLESSYRVPKSSMSKFLPEVLDAIYEGLEEYIQIPKTTEEWISIERGYNNRWNFPGCCGALEGKHINIQQPEHTGSDFYNYKGYFSTVLLALVDSNYCFTFIEVGSQGRVNDNSIFNNSILKRKLESETLNFPTWGVILGDEAFPLKKYLMKPYSRRLPLTTEEKIFNYRLSHARRTVENAFGIMVMKFRIYRTPIYVCPVKVDKIVKATCALHNWLVKTSTRYYAPTGVMDSDDIDGSWRLEPRSSYVTDLGNHGSNHYSQMAEQRRQKYKNYFVREGAVPWQNSRIF
ncbi:uncharacterized protein LOC126968827 [Leptidea sinapis]|uniref:uncharacterized protein LOC126968827 n=1 Tax=Leptidea sinapis TaxID=189913 RepID=UPI0021242B77|nr:uncharacterized protein LOC126968827 [Leptidea sinapis]